MWTMMYVNIFGDCERSSIVTSDCKDPDSFYEAAHIAMRLYGNSLMGVWNEKGVDDCQKIDLSQ